MTVSIELDDMQALREQQEALCKAMGPHELNAYFRGFPPSTSCVANPQEFANALANGAFDPEQTPLAQARQALEEIFGPSEPMQKLAQNFAYQSAPDLGAAPDKLSMSFPFKLGNG